MKTLIVYYSFTQNNEKLAEHLRQELNCDVVRIEEQKKRTGLTIILDLLFNRMPAIKTLPYYLKDYDKIIFIAPVWAGKIASPLRSFLRNERINITRYSFITVCGGRPGQAQKIRKELKSILHGDPENVVELWINNLLPADKNDTIKYTSGYRVQPEDFNRFENEISDFLKEPVPWLPVENP